MTDEELIQMVSGHDPQKTPLTKEDKIRMVKHLRDKHKKTAQEIADMLNFSVSTIRRWLKS